MSSNSALRIVFVALVSSSVQATVRHQGTKGTGSRSGFMNQKIKMVSKSELHGNLKQAMTEAVSHDHEVDFIDHDKIEEWLKPAFKALPKNAQGLVELQVMEHTLYRYFMQTYSVSLKPFEPHRPLNAAEWSASEVISDRAPAFVEEILKGRFYHNGFKFEDAATLIATLEHFLYDDSVRRLRTAYKKRGYGEDAVLQQWDALRSIYAFLKLMDGEGEQDIVIDENAVPLEVSQFISGELERVKYQRRRGGLSKLHLSDSFTFREVAHAAHSLVLSSSEFFSDCDSLRDHMIKFDKDATGRATLADLYRDNTHATYSFGESKDWLRRMGVLDESSIFKGARVIIPNYISAASNCIMTTSLFRQCCPNRECQKSFHKLESQLAKPENEVPEIWEALEIGGYDIEEKSKKDMAELTGKLANIADHHSGKIPIHGRLFQQFLHYLQPQQCPYPYKRGQVVAENLKDCGHDCLIDTDAELLQEEGSSIEGMDIPEHLLADWMGKWEMEEELLHTPTVPVAAEPVVRTESDMPPGFTGLGKTLILVVVIFGLAGLSVFRVKSDEAESKGQC